MNEFDRYLKLKKKFKPVFRGHNLNKLIAVVLISDSYNHIKIPKLSLKDLISKILYVNIYKNLNKVLEHDGILLSHSKWKRHDYIELVNLMGASLKSSLVFDFEYKKVKINEISILLKSFCEVFQYLRNDFCFKQLVYLATELNEIKYKLIVLEKEIQKSNIKGFIAFNSSIFDDAIFCSVFNKYKINTYSLQHGFYNPYKMYIPLDIINYENITANKLLCWGNSTFINMKDYGISSNKLMVLGNPRIYTFEKINIKKPKFKKCLVLFGRDIYHSSNITLLNLLLEINENSGEEFILKLHPSLKLKNLDKEYICKFPVLDTKISVEQAIVSQNCEWSISNNTSACLDSQINGVICFRYAKFENEDYGDTIFKFNNLDEYYKLKQEISAKGKNFIENIIMDTLKYNFCDNFNENISNFNRQLLSK